VENEDLLNQFRVKLKKAIEDVCVGGKEE